ncbi:membrane protein [Mesorhizobium tianshanense]|nr:membrane protein [Mesorhizobium tianshanense]
MAIKLVGPGLSIFEIAFLETFFGAVILLATRHPNEKWTEFWRTERPLAVHARAISGVVASICAVYALTTIPLMDAYALLFLAPFFVTVMSIFILKEHVGIWRWLAVFAGFVGVLLVVKPGFQTFELGHWAATCAGLATGSSILIMRSVGGAAKKTSVLGTLMVYLLTFNLCAMLVVGITVPSLGQFLTLVCGGVCFGLGQLALLTAARSGNANQIAPMHYSQLAWATAFGLFLFGEHLDLWAIVGVFVIACAGILTVFRESIRGRAARSAPASRP